MSSIGKSFFQYAAWPTLLVLLLGQGIQGQNLVPNPSFEDVNTCSEFNQPCSPSAWFYLSRKFTTGYFPRFRSATGSRHLQIVAASRETPNRQYWETRLLCPLQAGQRYTVSLKIAGPGNGPGNRSTLSPTCPNLRDIGFWFTRRFVFVQGDSILQPRSYLSFTDAKPKDLKNGWFEIKKEFLPTGNSTVLVVGNFARAANTDIMDQRNLPNSTIDILVDDISIVGPNGSTCATYQNVKDTLYSIHSRHSDVLAGDPDDPDNPVESEPRKSVPEARQPFPGSHQSVDTPKSPHRPPATDTIIIYNILFDFDKYLIQNPDTLQRYRSLLTKPDVKKIQVVGFTDDAGSEAYNLDLSQKRAREIASLLASKFDIPPAIIEAEGRGISRKYPTKYQNRRVEIYIYHE